MQAKAHKIVSRNVVKLYTRLCLDQDHPPKAFENAVTNVAGVTDDRKDLELVDVDLGKDNPHQDDLPEDSDDARHEEFGFNFSAWNHFIDIRKGAGQFDDYDGYSYRRGSGKNGQYQTLVDAKPGELLTGLFSAITGLPLFAVDTKVDAAIAWWYNDDYVHAPGFRWYRNCSSSVEHYSYFRQSGKYRTRNDEMDARFGKGFPQSVFMPLDNMGRYWYDHVVKTGHLPSLGHLVHAVQDASVPHHAAGCLGNWHSEYENALDDFVTPYARWSEATRDTITDSVTAWEQSRAAAPRGRLEYTKRDALVPSGRWRVDQLITWVALFAYNAYKSTYHRFRVPGGAMGATAVLEEDSARELTVIATAVSLLVLKRALDTTIVTGNKNTGELHTTKCWCVPEVSSRHLVRIPAAEALANDYDGCAHCMREFHSR